MLVVVSPALLSPHFSDGPFDPKQYAYWMPVDCYTGGIEHATMHLLYTRFFHKAMRDIGVTQGPEPMLQLRNQGQILGPDGQRMSKSRGNVIDPDEQVAAYGADTVRAYLMFGYRWSEGGPWGAENIQGAVRWLNRVWALVLETSGDKAQASPEAESDLRRKLHQTIRKVSDDLEGFEFNTVVSSLMELTNALTAGREAGQSGSPAFKEAVDGLLRMMAPVTPHLAEELWARLGLPYSIHQQAWPKYDPEAAKEDQFTLVIQVNGKVRERIVVPASIQEADAKAKALANATVQELLAGKTASQVIYVPGRLVNIVI